MNKRIEEIRDLCPLCKAPATIYGNVTKYCVSDYESLLAEHKLMRDVLESCKAAMAYAYEDHSDRYYINVLEQIRQALEKVSK